MAPLYFDGDISDEILGAHILLEQERPTHAFVWCCENIFLCDFYHEFSPPNFSFCRKMFSAAFIIGGGDIFVAYKQDLLAKFVPTRKLSEQKMILSTFPRCLSSTPPFVVVPISLWT